MRILFFLLFPIFLSAQINRAYGVIEIGASFPTSSATGPKFAYRPADSSFYRWVHTNYWVKVVEPSIIPDTLYLTEELGTTIKLSGDTIHLTPYLLKSDTASMLVRYIERGDTLGMLSAYIRSAGWGLLKSAYMLRADSTLLATRLFARNLPTYIANTRIAYSNGSNLVGSGNLVWDNTNVRLGIGGNPSNSIDVIKSSGSNYLRVFTNSNASGSDSRVRVQSNTDNLVFADFGKFSTGTAAYKIIGSGDAYVYNSGSGAGNDLNIFNDNSTGRVKIAAGGRTNADLTIHYNGNINIGTLATPSYILDINSTDALRLPRGTTAQKPTFNFGVLRGLTDDNSYEGYNGTRSFKILESTFARGTATRIPFFDANGQITDNSSIYTTNSNTGIHARTFTHNDAAQRTWGSTNYDGYLRLNFSRDAYILASDPWNLTYRTQDAATFNNSQGTQLWLNKPNATYNSHARAMVVGVPSAIGGGFQSSINNIFFGSMLIADPAATTTAQIESDLLISGSQAPNLIVTGRASFGRNTNSRPFWPSSWIDIDPDYSSTGDLGGRGYALTIRNSTYNNATTAAFGNVALSSITELVGGTLTSTNMGVTYSDHATFSVSATTAGSNSSITKKWAIRSLGDFLVTGNVRIGTSATPTQELDINGDALIRDTIFNTNPQTHSVIEGIAAWKNTAQGYALGKITFGSDLKVASGTLGLKHKSLIDSLPIGSVAIDGNDNPLAFNFLNSFTVDFENTAGSIVSDGDITEIESDSEIHLATGQYARLDLTDEVKLSAPNLEGENSFTVGYEGFYWNFVNESAAVLDSAFAVVTSGDRKLIRAHGYGNGYVDATYTGEYPGKYILATTANHNVMDYRIDRDTLVIDANFSVGTLLYYTQNLHINLRMTALASTNSTITFPDASDSFRSKSIYVRVLEKDPGIYVPVINVTGGVSRLLYTSSITTAPSDQTTLTMDNSTWPFFRTYKFTCLNTGTTPNYRWVLNQ